MKKYINRISTILFCILTINIVAGNSSASTNIPHKLSYQGRLLDNTGQPVTSIVTVDVDLYASETGGTSLYSESITNVSVINGIYSFYFGSTNSAFSDALSSPQCWLELTVDSETLAPRQQLVAVPYALNSKESDPVWSASAAASITNAGSGEVITDAERTKLSGIEDGADVTDAGNVSAAGAVMTNDIGVTVQAQNSNLDDLADGVLSKSKVEDSVNWDTAYGWGNHATNGYLTSEVDPNAVLADGSRAMTGDLNMGGNSITNISTNTIVYADGVSVAEKYVDVAGDIMRGTLTVSNDVIVASNLYVSGVVSGDGSGLTNVTASSYTETDPVYSASAASSISDAGSGEVITDAERTKLSGIEDGADVTDAGNVSAAGAVMTNDIGVTVQAQNSNLDDLADGLLSKSKVEDSANWDTAYGWGNHATNGYLTEESDTLQDVVNRGNTTSNAVTFGSASDTNVLLGSFQAGGDRKIEVNNLGFSVIDVSTTNTEFIVEQYAAGQWRIDAKGNPITNAVYYGDGSGLTNVTASSYTETDPIYSASAASSISDAGSGNVITDAERTKLSGIEDGADVTDAGNVSAAGAVMTNDIGVTVQAQNSNLDDLADGVLSRSKVEDSANWDAAYGWGNHATNGYLTSEVDPNAVLADGSRAMTGDLNMGGNSITNISTNTIVYADGVSVAEKYVDVAGDIMRGTLTVSNDVIVASNLYVSGVVSGDGSGLTNVTASSYTETDPVYSASAASSISDAGSGEVITDAERTKLSGIEDGADVTDASNVLAAGAVMTNDIGVTVQAQNSNLDDLADGLLSKSKVEDSVNWDTAYGWGNHATNGYLTEESDTLQDVVNRGNTTSNAVTFGSVSDTNVLLGSFQAGGDRKIEVNNLGFSVIDASTTNTEFIVEQYAAGQWRIDAKGNPITNAVYYGDGSGLTNITASSYTETDPVYGASPAASISDAGSGEVITDAERTKLSGIEDGADVTDAGNVSAAGAVMTNDIGVTVQAQNSNLDDLADGLLSKSKVEDSANWDTAYGWGNHATNGYLTSEVDPNAVLADGSRAMTGDLNMGGNSITNISTNTIVYADGVSVAEKYVDVAGDSMTGKLWLPEGGLTVGSASTQLVVLANGNIGIGEIAPTNKLAVNGTIKCKETIVTLDGWSDFVFEKDYKLMPLEQVDKYIQQNGHLPGIPSAKDVTANGVKMGEMQAKLLQKIEELTLHMIELEKENQRLNKIISERLIEDNTK